MFQIAPENKNPSWVFTIPRCCYTDNHMAVVAAALKNVYDRRETIRSWYKIVSEVEIMRHFTLL